MKIPARSRPHAFSLIELIIVIAVIAIIATFTIPAMNTVLKGTQLSQGSSTLVGQLNIARQQAISRNRQVEVRFYRFADPEIPGENVQDPKTGAFRAMQLFELRQSLQGDAVSVPLDKIQRLPSSIIFSHTDTNNGLSSLIDGTAQVRKPSEDPAAPRLPRGVDLNYEFVSLRFLPDGSTDRSPTGKWYITVVDHNAPVTVGRPPPNFFTVQIDPVSGTIRNYRPTAG